jgi:hypothetical protein
MITGRLVKVFSASDDVSATAIYAVATNDRDIAVRIIREARAQPGDRVEAVSMVSPALLSALGIGPGEFKRI